MFEAVALARAPRRTERMEEALADLIGRHASLERWVKENAPATAVDQRHLDDGSVERAYWHHGYMMALQDILCLLDMRRSLDS